MAKDPAFPFYAQDFLVGTMHMTNEEVGAYIKLLAYQWVNLGIQKKRLGFILGFGWESVWTSISDKFIEKDEILFNERLELERNKRAVFKSKQVENGKKGGRPRKKDESKTLENIEDKTQIKPKLNPNKNPDESQKKPLENEYENEYENKNDNKEIEKPKKIKNQIAKIEVTYPFSSESFKVQWQLWKVYKSKEFRFNFKSVQSEQANLNQLCNLSGGIEKTAIEIINQSMANGWKGFFELKNNNHGNITRGNNSSRTDVELRESANDAVNAMFGIPKSS